MAGTTRRTAQPVSVADAGALLERALFEVKKVVVGQDRMVERMAVALREWTLEEFLRQLDGQQPVRWSGPT